MTYPFKLLHEQVPDKDLSTDGTHEHVADTLFRLINHTNRGLTIGLEGSWGSGKSTVVSLLRQKFDEGTLFFLFDAWAHEGDPLRRIFLERLIETHDPAGENEALKTVKEAITQSQKTVTTTTSRTASRLGKYLSLAALPVPAGAAMLSSVEMSSVFMPWHIEAGSVHWPFASALLLAFMPIFPLIYWYFCGDKKDGKRDWSFLQSESTEESTQSTSEDAETTSIEFEHFFKQIMEHCLGSQNSCKRAVIVIDNLDRLDADKARHAWSSLQAFFQYRSVSQGTHDDWIQRIWFLVPYDRDGMIALWPDNDGANFDSTSDPNGVGKKIKKNRITNAFFDKCFQVTAEVPEMILSAWPAYLETCVQEALTGWSNEARQAVIRVYKNQHAHFDISPTPREIRCFINQVGLLGMRWGSTVSAEAMALYADLRLHRSEHEMRQRLLNRQALPLQNCDNPVQVERELANLLFGVSGNKGTQILLQKPLWRGMTTMEESTSDDNPTITQLIELYGEGFWIAWDSMKTTLIPEVRLDPPSTVISQDHLIAISHNMHKHMFAYRDKIRQEIQRLKNGWLLSKEPWRLNQLDYVQALASMAALADNATDFLDKCYEEISLHLSEQIKNIENKEITNIGLKNSASISAFLEKQGKPLPQENYRILNVNHWVTWCEALERLDIEISVVTPGDTTITKLGEALFAQTDASQRETLIIASRHSAVKNTGSPSWKKFGTLAISFFKNKIYNTGIVEYLSFLTSIYALEIPSIKKEIESWISNDTFWPMDNQSRPNRRLDIALVISGHVLKDRIQKLEKSSTRMKNAWASIHKNTLDELVQILESNKITLDFWSIAKDPRNTVALSALAGGRCIDMSNEVVILDFFHTVANTTNKELWPQETLDRIIEHLPGPLATQARAILGTQTHTDKPKAS